METKQPRHNVASYALLTLAWLLTASSVQAQQVTGLPGSPSATVTLDGKQLAAAPEISVA